MRYPTTPHEIGWDTFSIHILANSISEFGWARWWVHPLSIGGFYPCSYASSVPFLVSGISQCTDIDVEWTVWVFCMLIGIFSIFFAYIMAGAIINDDLFKFLVAFGFSVSPIVVEYSTWQLSARGLFVVLLPIFIYSLLKTHNSLKYIILLPIFFMLSMMTHHLTWLVIPVIFSYAAVAIVYKLKKRINYRVNNNVINIVYIILFVILLSMPFFTRFLISEVSSRYLWLICLAQTYVRFFGVMIIFTLSGFTYLMFKHNKKREEWFLMLTSLGFMPLLYAYRYGKFFLIIFAITLAGIGLVNVTGTSDTQKRKYAIAAVAICLLLAVSFSGFYQHYRTNIIGRPTYNERYMEDGTYIAAMWIKENVDKRMVCNDMPTRVFAISEVPTLTGDGTIDLTYGLTTITDLSMSKVSPLSTEFYFEGMYVRTPRTPYTGYYESLINEVDFDHTYGRQVISKFNLSYAVENEDIGDNPFIRSIHRDKDNVYDNAKIRVWRLD
jgi:hypothetical protein